MTLRAQITFSKNRITDCQSNFTLDLVVRKNVNAYKPIYILLDSQINSFTLQSINFNVLLF